jgi:CDK inhibitor PHO81
MILKVLPKTVGFNIEIHGGQFGSTNAWDANAVVDRVLHLAYEEGGQGGRPIVFSSEDPLACTMLNWKQPNHAVFFATRAGYNADRGDNRRNSIKEAVRFARQENLLGIVCDARPLVSHSTLFLIFFPL